MPFAGIYDESTVFDVIYKAVFFCYSPGISVPAPEGFGFAYPFHRAFALDAF